jgi:hypothetical protein
MAATLANLTHRNGRYCGVVTQDASIKAFARDCQISAAIHYIEQ